MVLTLDRKVTRLCASNSLSHIDCVFKMVHYKDSPEHFNAVCPLVWDENAPLALMRERILLKLKDFGGCAYWCVQSLDPFLIAEEILPVLEPSSDGEDVQSISSEQDDSRDVSAAVPLPVPCGSQDEAMSGSGEPIHAKSVSSCQERVVPRAMPSSESPHPRALQEQRFAEIAKQWHDWVVVPEFINGVRTTRELLDSGICLPKKHCFWKGCQWTGFDNTAKNSE